MPRFLGSGPKSQYFDNNGEFLVGGFLYSYEPNTLTPRATYPTIADALAGTNANSNPVELDNRGEANVVINGATDLVLKDENDNLVWSVDAVEQASSDILDPNGNEVLIFSYVSSAVNEITVTNAATSNGPTIASSGGDTNIDLNIDTKGSGKVVFAAEVTGVLPVGSIIWKASTNVPTGYLECDGSAVSRTTYAALFADIGTTWGVGNGSTTFNLPNQARRVIVGRGGAGTATLAAALGSTGGAETHTLTTAEMPAHTHSYQKDSYANLFGAGSATGNNTDVLAGTTGSTGGDGAHNNMQPSMVMMMCIKYN